MIAPSGGTPPALAVTAGVCEEIVFRGLLIAVGVHVLGLPLPVAAGLALALFAIGHLYQGPRGMIAVTLFGLASPCSTCGPAA